MTDRDDTRSFHQIKAYPRGSAQGGRALQAVKGNLVENQGASGHRTVIRETSEGRAVGRTRDGMPMVEVEKRGDVIGVDHGVIDMLSVAPLNPDSYKDGVLWRTPFVDAYIVASEATPDDPNNPIVDELEDIPENIKGVAPADGTTAKSCRANKDRTNQDALYAKKVTMGQCPASLFTGRTRLWVQAMYGRHDELSLCALYIQALSVPPGLSLSGVDADSFFLNTNVGVYYEAATGKHWCIKVSTTHADIYPMEAQTDAVEDLRDFLVDPSLSASEKEKVETYILSDSIPVISKKQTVSFAYVVDWSMGYGWHFNWDGDRCDIVTNATLAYGGGGEHNESNHYRLTFTKNEVGVWAVTRQVVEGPVYWKARRNVDVIAAPLWEDGSLEKFGAHLGPLPYGNAPIYAFYAKNELKVCRYSATTGTHEYSGVTREPAYVNPAIRYTIGSDPMHVRWRSAWSDSTTTFSCGSVSASYVSGSHTDTVITRTSPNSGDYAAKVELGPSDLYMTGVQEWNVGQPTSIPMTTIFDSYFGSINVYAGLDGSGGMTYNTSSFGPFDGSTRESFGTLYARATEETYTSYVGKYTQFIVVIPYYDAEAVYIHGQYLQEDHEVGSAGVVNGPWFQYRGEYESSSIDAVFGTGGSSGPAESTTAFDRYNTTNSSVSKLVCSAGVFEATFPGSSGFWSVNDTVGQQYPTYTSASANAVKADSNGVDSGNPTGTDASIYVGWA